MGTEVRCDCFLSSFLPWHLQLRFSGLGAWERRKEKAREVERFLFADGFKVSGLRGYLKLSFNYFIIIIFLQHSIPSHTVEMD